MHILPNTRPFVPKPRPLFPFKPGSPAFRRTWVFTGSTLWPTQSFEALPRDIVSGWWSTRVGQCTHVFAVTKKHVSRAENREPFRLRCDPDFSRIFLVTPEKKNSPRDPVALPLKKALLGWGKHVTQVCCTGHGELCGRVWLKVNESRAVSFGLLQPIAHNVGILWLLSRMALILNQGHSRSVDMEGAC